MTQPKLKLVETLDDQIRDQFAKHDLALSEMKRSEEEIKRLGRVIAAERGIAFLRFESLRQEFGPIQYRGEM